MWCPYRAQVASIDVQTAGTTTLMCLADCDDADRAKALDLLATKIKTPGQTDCIEGKCAMWRHHDSDCGLMHQ